MLNSLRLKIAVALTMLASTFLASAQGTAFTYQGYLTASGGPANGSYDLQFTLFDAGTNGNLIGGPLTNAPTLVSNGLFAVQLDFGSNVFHGNPYWLQIGARTNGDVNPYVILTPLQEMTPTPYAIFAPNAGTAQTAASAGSVAAANISGTMTTAQLPANLVTNNATGVNFTGTFSGNGAGVSNIILSSVNSGGAITDTIVPTGNFVFSATLAVGPSPFQALATDVNGDGHVDLISLTPSYINNTLTVLTNDGTGHFVRSTAIAVGGSPISVAAADVNGDGHVDLICADSNNNILDVLLNDGTGHFNLSATLPVGSYPQWVVAADVNGDRHVDLICADFHGNTLTVLTNDGTGNFALSATLPVGSYPISAAAADVNGDGYVDLISANLMDNSLTVLTNDRTGHFAFSATLSVGLSPDSIATADVNGDGHVDLICADSSESCLTVLTNDGTGHFVLSSSPTTGLSPDSVAAADVNGDGHVDLISANYNASTLSVLTNDGTGHFNLSATLPVGSYPQSVVATNIVGNAGVDLVSANNGANTLTVLTNVVRIAYAYNGNFSGNGSGLTKLNASQIASGTVPLAQLPSAVVTNTETGVTLSGTFNGNGGGLTNLNASQIASGTIPLAQLPSAVVTNTETVVTLGGTFSGNGSGLSNLNASQIVSGTVPLAQLPSAVVTNTETGVTLGGTFSGNGSGLTSVNASFLAGNAIANTSTGLVLSAGLNAQLFNAIGSGAQFNLYDRGGVATYGQWSYYALDGRAYFWNSLNNNRMSIDSSGNVRAAGSFTASTTPDLAETIPAADDVEAGDIVCADPQRPESVIRSSRDSRGVLGVISDGTSGFIINANGKSVEGSLTGKPLVLAGRVPVKVSLENGPVKIGDYLAPSSVPGVAMRANGTGTVIGVALSPFDAEHQEAWGQAGKVLCFIKIGDASSASKIRQLEEQNNTLADRLQKLEKMVQSLQDQQPTRPAP